MGCENDLEEQEEEPQLKNDKFESRARMLLEKAQQIRHFSVLLNIKAEKVEAHSDLQYSVT